MLSIIGQVVIYHTGKVEIQELIITKIAYMLTWVYSEKTPNSTYKGRDCAPG